MMEELGRIRAKGEEKEAEFVRFEKGPSERSCPIRLKTFILSSIGGRQVTSVLNKRKASVYIVQREPVRKPGDLKRFLATARSVAKVVPDNMTCQN